MGDEQDEVDFSISDDELDASPDKVLGYAQLLANPELLMTLDTNSDEGWRQFSDSIVHFIGDFAGTKSKLQKSVDELTARNEKLQGVIEEMDRLQQPSVLTGKQTSATKFPKFPAIDKFQGVSDERRVDDFLALARDSFKYASEPLDKKLWAIHGRALLTGQASVYFADVTRGRNLSGMTWKEFGAILLKAYGTVDNEPQFRANFFALKQRSSVRVLIREFQELSSQITRPSIDEGTQIHIFQQALSPQLQAKCVTDSAGHPWASLHSLMDFAILQEASLLSLKNSMRASAGTFTMSGDRIHAVVSGPSGNTSKKSKGKYSSGAGPSGGAGPSSGGEKRNFKVYEDGRTVFGTLAKEHQKRLDEGLCFYCGGNHALPACDYKADGQAQRASPAGNVPKKAIKFAAASRKSGFQPASKRQRS